MNSALRHPGDLGNQCPDSEPSAPSSDRPGWSALVERPQLLPTPRDRSCSWNTLNGTVAPSWDCSNTAVKGRPPSIHPRSVPWEVGRGGGLQRRPNRCTTERASDCSPRRAGTGLLDNSLRQQQSEFADFVRIRSGVSLTTHAGAGVVGGGGSRARQVPTHAGERAAVRPVPTHSVGEGGASPRRRARRAARSSSLSWACATLLVDWPEARREMRCRISAVSAMRFTSSASSAGTVSSASLARVIARSAPSSAAGWMSSSSVTMRCTTSVRRRSAAHFACRFAAERFCASTAVSGVNVTC